MNIERIKEMVEADLKIDGTELGDESIRTPQLHGKYLNIYHDESLILKKLDADWKIIRPPHLPLSAEQEGKLFAAFDASGFALAKAA